MATATMQPKNNSIDFSIAPAPKRIDKKLEYNGMLITEIVQKSMDGSRDLSEVPGLIVEMIERDSWREFFNPDHKVYAKHEDFNAFVTASYPHGMGMKLDQLKALCRDRPDAVDAIDRVCQQPIGVNQHTDNIRPQDPVSKKGGTSIEYGLRRLRKDRPDLHQRVLAKEMSVHAACVEAGFRKKPTALEQAKKLFEKMSREDLDEIMAWATSRFQR